jgi:diguanylate cyclase (GGDEF)-like protein
MKLELRKDALVRTAIATGVAVAMSAIISLVSTALVFGIDLNATITVAAVYKFGMLAAVMVPLSICPFMRYPTVVAVSDLDRAHAELRRVAQTDQLTGLLNRRGFAAAAQLAISEQGRNAVNAVLMLDADFFKDINDRFGHDFGDAALVHIADVIRDMSLGTPFIVGRRRGAGMKVLMPGAGRSAAASFAESVRAACASKLLTYGAKTALVTMSIGVASSEDRAASLAHLISEADAALYRAKQDGRNRVVLAQSAERAVAAA